MRPQLKDRVAIVTGASRGIGKAIAECLAESGASVALTDLDFTEAKKNAAFIRTKYNADSIALQLDVTSVDSVRSATEQILKRFGKVDILVNNAGVVTLHPILSIPEEDWDLVMNVNAKGALLMIQAISKEMIARNVRGCIVNIASIAGKVPLIYQAHYCASKAALIALTRSSAMELAPYGIRVNAVCPGAVDTELYSKVVEQTAKMDGTSFEKLNEQIVGSTYLGRLINPAEIGRVVAFLCSDDALAINGQAININGGSSSVNY